MFTPGYKSLKAEWWSLIKASKYPQSSDKIVWANKISIISKSQRKFSQCSSPSGIKCPIMRGKK